VFIDHSLELLDFLHTLFVALARQLGGTGEGRMVTGDALGLGDGVGLSGDDPDPGRWDRWSGCSMTDLLDSWC